MFDNVFSFTNYLNGHIILYFQYFTTRQQLIKSIIKNFVTFLMPNNTIGCLWLCYLQTHVKGRKVEPGHFPFFDVWTFYVTPNCISLSNSRYILTFRYMTYQFKRNPNTIPIFKIICTIFLKFYFSAFNMSLQIA
jgi:hypothetical protein